MTAKRDRLAASGARFCGEVNASISHEIKNVMAIINENAGLLEDMVALHQQGAPFDDARLVKLARSVSRQITRANDIIGVMNRFAHSADHDREPVDIGETVQFMIKLTDRLVALQGHRFDLHLPEKAATITTSRFYLQYTIWCCLQAVMQASRPDDAIQIRVEAGKSEIGLTFGGQAMFNHSAGASLSPLEESGVLTLLEARMVLQPGTGAFQIYLPREAPKTIM